MEDHRLCAIVGSELNHVDNILQGALCNRGVNTNFETLRITGPQKLQQIWLRLFPYTPFPNFIKSAADGIERQHNGSIRLSQKLDNAVAKQSPIRLYF